MFLLSESKFPGKGGIAYQADIRSVHFGERNHIDPTPPPSERAGAESGQYLWFKLASPNAVKPVLSYTGHPPRFAFTTRLAFREASNLAELLLIREPERRFYRECRLAGFDVAVYDESIGIGQVFDIGQLRLRFSVSKGVGPVLSVRFDPWTAEFKSSGFSFTWSELMFCPADCLALIRDAAYI